MPTAPGHWNPIFLAPVPVYIVDLACYAIWFRITSNKDHCFARQITAHQLIWKFDLWWPINLYTHNTEAYDIESWRYSNSLDMNGSQARVWALDKFMTWSKKKNGWSYHKLLKSQQITWCSSAICATSGCSLYPAATATTKNFGPTAFSQRRALLSAFSTSSNSRQAGNIVVAHTSRTGWKSVG